MNKVFNNSSDPNFKAGIEHFIRSVRNNFLNRTSDEPQGFVSDKFLVHIEPFTNLIVRIVLEDQCGFDEGELESNALAFKGQDDLIYSPWIRLGLEIPSKEQLKASDYEIINFSLDEHVVALEGYSVDENLISDEGISTLAKWMIEDLTYLQKLPYLYPVDLLNNHKNLTAEPFMAVNESGIASPQGLKNFDSIDDLQRDLQSFICQYAGTILAVSSLESCHLDYSVEPLKVKFKYLDEACDVILGLNQNPPELLECSMCAENSNQEITLQLGKKDLEDYSEKFSEKLTSQFLKSLNVNNIYKR